jgi:hypothetical protein
MSKARRSAPWCYPAPRGTELSRLFQNTIKLSGNRHECGAADRDYPTSDVSRISQDSDPSCLTSAEPHHSPAPSDPCSRPGVIGKRPAPVFLSCKSVIQVCVCARKLLGSARRRSRRSNRLAGLSLLSVRTTPSAYQPKSARAGLSTSRRPKSTYGVSCSPAKR